MSFEDLQNDGINKENIDLYLKELAKVLKKLNGNKTPAEIILVGGASVLTGYNFRKSTNDIDAIILASSALKEAIRIISDKFQIPGNWLNTDFKNTKSYTSKLRGVSVFYKNYFNILEIRKVDSEYLIAMKLMAGRNYKHDLSDIVGIFWKKQETGNPIKREHIQNAVSTLYNGWNEIPENSKIFIDKVFECTDYKKLYFETKNKENNANNMLKEFNIKYPDIITKDNADIILKQLQKKEYGIITPMECIKYDITKNKVLKDLLGNKAEVNTLENITNNKNEHISKLQYKNKEGRSIFVLQRIREDNVDIWHFKNNFNKESAYIFIRQFDKKIL
jgi:hypothetical protein